MSKHLLETNLNFKNMNINVFLPSRYSFYDRLNDKYSIDYNKLTKEGYIVPILFTGSFENCNICLCGSEFENVKLEIFEKD